MRTFGCALLASVLTKEKRFRNVLLENAQRAVCYIKVYSMSLFDGVRYQIPERLARFNVLSIHPKSDIKVKMISL